MNHYERLKVAHDAPAEVIRAAYRALATKVHPDRQGPNTSPEDALHAEMAALNAAYETLIDPKLRADYDATLAPGAAHNSPWHRQAVDMAAEAHANVDAGLGSRVDMDWLTPGRGAGAQVAAATSWTRNPRALLMAGVVGAAVLAVGGAAVWRMLSQRQMEDALSRQYHAQGDTDLPTGRVGDRPAAGRDDGARKPTVDELAKMSDEELVKVLPTLDGREAPADAPAPEHRGRRHANQQALLDGPPLQLKTERQLVDPLAGAPARP